MEEAVVATPAATEDVVATDSGVVEEVAEKVPEKKSSKKSKKPEEVDVKEIKVEGGHKSKGMDDNLGDHHSTTTRVTTFNKGDHPEGAHTGGITSYTTMAQEHKGDQAVLGDLGQERSATVKKVLETSNFTSPGLRMLYDSRIKELEEELDVERASRMRSERQRNEIQNDLSLMAERVEEQGDNAKRQGDLNRKLEMDVNRLQRELEDCQVHSETQLSSFRKKHQDAINQLNDQLETVQKAKQRSDKEKTLLRNETEDLKSQLEIITKTKTYSDKLVKQQDGQLNELKSQVAELHKNLTEAQSFKTRLQSDNAELIKRFEDSESQLLMVTKAKGSNNKQIEELKLILDDEAAIRTKLLSDNRSLQGSLDQLQETLDEELQIKEDFQRQLARMTSESQVWRQKFEGGEGNIRPEEVEELKKKLLARINDGEAQLEAVVGKAVGLEKAKSRLLGENQNLHNDLQKMEAVITQNEKRQRQFEKNLDEWKKKASDQQSELETFQKESRGSTAEAYKFKTQLDEVQETVDALKRENKNMSEEIYELNDQNSQGSHRFAELEKLSKRIESERDELHATLEEAEKALEREEAKIQQGLQEIASLKEEHQRRLAEKEEEFEVVCKNQQRVIDTMQVDLESEVRHKIEALKAKKKLEQIIMDLEGALEVANKSKQEVEKGVKKLQQQTHDLQRLLEDEQKARNCAVKEAALIEKKIVLLSNEIEEGKAQLEISERNRRMLDGEVQKLGDMVAELQNSNSQLSASKKKTELDLQTFVTDLEEKTSALKHSEEQTRKAGGDASKVAEELRQEQEHSTQIEKVRRSLETQVKELQKRLDEAEASILQGGKKQIQGLEGRLSEAEKEIEKEQQKHTEAQKIIRKQERRIQELHFQLDEATKEHDKLNGLVDKLQHKMQGYKKQAMEAEEIAALNVGKYRKLQQELEESEARADLAESLSGQYRSNSRSSINRAESLQPLAYSGLSGLSGYSGLSGLKMPTYHTDYTSHSGHSLGDYQLPPSGVTVKTTRVHQESKTDNQ